ncbi:MAG TPA: hypothetical protein VJL38_03530 [Patescibacteria group bacterium]|nr:hypothetical protein [Patescibacteria group bacterium]
MRRTIFLGMICGVCTLLIGASVWFFFFRQEQKTIFVPRAGEFAPFHTATVSPALRVDGSGTNIDAVAFWEAPTPEEATLFVSGKGNDVIEQWRYPFSGVELPPLHLAWRPNGLRVDHVGKKLLVGNSEDATVEIFSLPDLVHTQTIGREIIASGETDVDVLYRDDGTAWIFATEDDAVRAFDGASGEQRLHFMPDVDSIEEIVVDGFHRAIYVPEESGIASKKHPRGAVLTYDFDGMPKTINGRTAFGTDGVFSGDEEGIALYACPADGTADDGRGFLIVVDQAGADTSFEFFDRTTWAHLGTLTIAGVTGTDGIAITQKPLPNFPRGIFAVTDNNKSVALVDMEMILEKTGLWCSGA